MHFVISTLKYKSAIIILQVLLSLARTVQTYLRKETAGYYYYYYYYYSYCSYYYYYSCQATVHLYEAFWGLLLPVTVHGRVSDRPSYYYIIMIIIIIIMNIIIIIIMILIIVIMYVYIYIHTSYVCVCVCIYIYIYIYLYVLHISMVIAHIEVMFIRLSNYATNVVIWLHSLITI